MDTNELNSELRIQNDNMTILQECLKNINSVIQGTDFLENSNEITQLLREVKVNLDDVRTNISNLENLQQASNRSDINVEEFESFASSCRESITSTSIELNKFLLDYIKLTSFQTTSPINMSGNIDSVHKIFPINPDTSTSYDNVNKNQQSGISSSDINKNDVEKEFQDNKILIISRKRNRVFLPYTVNDLEKILKTNRQYKSYSEIINDQFVIPLSRYKNPALSRFRETYNLMRKKEKSSVVDSLDMALDLTFNGKLNPAIITACKSLEQLELYLDCLEMNELSKFDCFEIKYEVLPTKR